MKAAVVYFSGTKNTYRVGEVYKENLEETGYKVDMINIDNHKRQLEDYDLFVLGSPTYSKVASKELIQFISTNINKKQNPNAKAMTFITHSWGTAFGHISLAHALETAGINVVAAQAYLMPNNFYMFSNKKASKPEMIKMYEDNITKLDQVFKAFKSGKALIDERKELPRTLLELQYKLAQKVFIPGFAKKTLSVDSNKCTKCNACVKQCPTRNIHFKDEEIEFESNCLACTKCYNICPANAYLYKNKEIDQYQENSKSIRSKVRT